MATTARNTSLDFDPDMQARQDNEQRLAQIAEAQEHGREVSFAGAQKHMRFSWAKAAAPIEDLVESLYGYFETAAAVKVAGGGSAPFDKESVQLSVHLDQVAYTISQDGMGNGLALLGKYLQDPRFQDICRQHNVSDVYTPSNDLHVQDKRVQNHNQPRPL